MGCCYFRQPNKLNRDSSSSCKYFDIDLSLSLNVQYLRCSFSKTKTHESIPLQKGSRKRSPRSTKGGGRSATAAAAAGAGVDGVDSDPPSTELVGAAAEERGLWLAALRATVSTVRCASRFVPAFVQDFESAGGYETVGYMVRRSSIDRLPAMLEQVSPILCFGLRWRALFWIVRSEHAPLWGGR